MGQQRRKYTEDYKAAAVERLYEPGATQGSVAKELGITGTQLKTWRLEIEAFGSAEAKRRQQADAAELVRLRKENKKLAEEVEITGTLTAFNVNFEDAEKLASNFHPIKPDALANSSTGEYWCRTSGKVELAVGFSPSDQAFMGRGSAGRVVRNTRRRYGRDVRKVQADFAKWWG